MPVQQHSVDVAKKLAVSGINIRSVRRDTSQPPPLRNLCRWVTAFLDAYDCEVEAEDEEMRYLVAGSHVDDSIEDAKSPHPSSGSGLGASGHFTPRPTVGVSPRSANPYQMGSSSRSHVLASPMEGDYETKTNG